MRFEILSANQQTVCRRKGTEIGKRIALNALVTLVRMPFGGAVCALLALLAIVATPFEFLFGIVAFPVVAVAMSREGLKKLYGKWPLNCLTKVPQECGKVWAWVVGK